MPVHINEMRSDEISYTHRDEHTGKYTTYAVSRITQFINLHASKVGLYRVPVDPAFAEFISRNRGVEAHRLLSLLEAEYVKPIIMLRMPDDSCLIVDGNHRYMVAAIANAKTIDAYILTQEQWEPFVVEGIPEQMQARVLGIPSGLNDKGEVPQRD